MTLRRACLSQDLKNEQAGEEEWETAPGGGDGMYKRPGAGKIRRDVKRAAGNSAQPARGAWLRRGLVWKAGNQVQVGGNAILVPSRVMGAKDTNLVITCRKMVSEIKRLRQGREREQSWTATLYGATFI